MNIFKKFSGWLSHPSVKIAAGVLLVLGIIAGVAAVIIINVALEHTNNMEFCTSCHEMETPLEEYKESIHYQNRVGVRATCPDCHVPKGGLSKYLAKLAAVKDILGSFTGEINTPEKYEALRGEMAKSVWEKMRATDSRECRSCHQFDAMKLEAQGKSARKKHTSAMNDEGKEHETCIDCHQGIVHQLPQDES